MYNWYQWLAFFYIYGFLGWVWETAYVSVGKRRFVNRGFVHGPIIPMYAFGALMMVILAMPVKDNLVLSYLVGVAGTTLLELVTGWAMEKIFRVRYWDYRYRKIQFHGYISLVSSLFWGLLTILLVNWMHPLMETFVGSIDTPLLAAADAALSVIFLIDFAISTKQALDLRKVLISLEKLYAEMETVQKELAAHLEESRERMDERIAQSKEHLDEHITQSKERIDEHIAQSKERLDERMTQSKERIDEHIAQSREHMEEYAARSKEKLEGYRETAAARMESGREIVADHLEESRERMNAAWEDRKSQAGERRRELELRMARLRRTKEQQVADLVAAGEKLRLRHPTASFGRWDDLVWHGKREADCGKEAELPERQAEECGESK